MGEKFRRIVGAAVLALLVSTLGMQTAMAAGAPVGVADPAIPDKGTSAPGESIGPESRLTDWVLRATLYLWFLMAQYQWWQSFMMNQIRTWCSDEAAAFIEANWTPLAQQMNTLAHVPTTLTINLVYDRLVQYVLGSGANNSVAVSAANALKQGLISLSQRF